MLGSVNRKCGVGGGGSGGRVLGGGGGGRGFVGREMEERNCDENNVSKSEILFVRITIID